MSALMIPAIGLASLPSWFVVGSCAAGLVSLLVAYPKVLPKDKRIAGGALAIGVALTATVVKPVVPHPQFVSVICKYAPWLPECIVIPPSAAQRTR